MQLARKVFQDFVQLPRKLRAGLAPSFAEARKHALKPPFENERQNNDPHRFFVNTNKSVTIVEHRSMSVQCGVFQIAILRRYVHAKSGSRKRCATKDEFAEACPKQYSKG